MNELTPDEYRILVDAIHDSATIIHKGQMMNDWTKSLAMQYAHKMGNSLLYNAAFIEEFAELIVRECASVALREDHDPYECILNHFGVEK